MCCTVVLEVLLAHLGNIASYFANQLSTIQITIIQAIVSR